MLPIDPPLAALHGQRLDHSGAIAREALNAAEHLTSGMIELHSTIFDRFARNSEEREHAAPMMAVLDVATDPYVQGLGADLVKAQFRFAAELGTRMIALNEWHQHGMNALWSQWVSQLERHNAGLPFSSGMTVFQRAIESADHAVSEAAVVAVQATEVVTEQIESVEAAVAPRRRNAKN